MRNVFELSREELSWLEDKFMRYKQLDKEIAVRKEELKMKQADDNKEGGKSNLPSAPVQSQVIKEQMDPYIRTRQTWKKAIEKVYSESSPEVQDIIRKKYWSDQSYQSWTDLGEAYYISKTQVYRLRYNVLEAFAKEIGYL